MPLSAPSKRKLTHTRVVTCRGFERHDKLWDIEGRIVDTKPYAFPNKDRGGEIKADEPLHDMSIRLTIDNDLKVHDAEAVIDASPYNYCKCVTPIVKQLIGLRIAPGWTLKSKSAMGDNRGCTHLTELLGPMATTAIQTLFSKRPGRDASDGSQRRKTSSHFIDSCHALLAHSPVVKQHWPDKYRAINKDESMI
jgi:hypothetical protein